MRSEPYRASTKLDAGVSRGKATGQSKTTFSLFCPMGG